MKRCILDTNGLISYITDRNIQQQNKIARVLGLAASFKLEIIIIENVITEFVYVMQTVYGVKARLIKEILETLLATTGIVIESDFDLNGVLELWPLKISEFGDALIASYASQKNLPVLTFDRVLKKHLKKLDVQCLEI